ncbi:MAG: hypothetical protein AAF667_11450 [Pseudomonadota bacterium]
MFAWIRQSLRDLWHHTWYSPDEKAVLLTALAMVIGGIFLTRLLLKTSPDAGTWWTRAFLIAGIVTGAATCAALLLIFRDFD